MVLSYFLIFYMVSLVAMESEQQESNLEIKQLISYCPDFKKMIKPYCFHINELPFFYDRQSTQKGYIGQIFNNDGTHEEPFVKHKDDKNAYWAQPRVYLKTIIHPFLNQRLLEEKWYNKPQARGCTTRLENTADNPLHFILIDRCIKGRLRYYDSYVADTIANRYVIRDLNADWKYARIGKLHEITAHKQSLALSFLNSENYLVIFNNWQHQESLRHFMFRQHSDPSAGQISSLCFVTQRILLGIKNKQLYLFMVPEAPQEHTYELEYALIKTPFEINKMVIDGSQEFPGCAIILTDQGEFRFVDVLQRKTLSILGTIKKPELVKKMWWQGNSIYFMQEVDEYEQLHEIDLGLAIAQQELLKT